MQVGVIDVTLEAEIEALGDHLALRWIERFEGHPFRAGEEGRREPAVGADLAAELDGAGHAEVLALRRQLKVDAASTNGNRLEIGALILAAAIPDRLAEPFAGRE